MVKHLEYGETGFTFLVEIILQNMFFYKVLYT